MPTNHIDIAITQDQLDSVLAAVKALEAAAPFLIDLRSEQRKTMVRYSDKDLGFILKALAIAEQHPEILPPSFNLDAMRRDVDALNKLTTMLQGLTRITGLFEDSRYAAGSESEGHALTVYQFIKTHHALTGELEEAVADLGKQFARKPPKPAPT